MFWYPDYSNVIATLEPNKSYTATEKCWLIGNFGSTGTTTSLNINGIDVIKAYSGSGSARDNVGVFIPINAGDIIIAKSSFVNLSLYGIK